MEARGVILKLDENLSRHLKVRLAELGYDVVTVSDEGLLSRPDHVVGEAARTEGRMLFTLDLDFANLVKFPPGTHPGIVLFRPSTLGPVEVNRFVTEFASRYDLTLLVGALVVVEPGRVRVRRAEAR